MRLLGRSSISVIAGLCFATGISARASETAPVETATTHRVSEALAAPTPRLAPRRLAPTIDVEPVQLGVLQGELPFSEETSGLSQETLVMGRLSRNFRIELETLRAQVRSRGFLSVEERLQTGRAVASPENHLDATLLLATLYIAHDLHAEALSAIDELEGAHEYPDFALLSGISSFKMGRFEEAVEILGADVLREDTEARRWRGIANARRGAYKDAAVDLIGAPAGVLSFEEGTAAFFLAKAETAMALEEYVVAREALDGLQRSPLNNNQRAQRALLEAQLMLVNQRTDPAREVLQQLVRSGPAPFANMAAVELLEDGFNHGTLGPDQAASRTDALMLTWQGGAFERCALAFGAAMYEAADDVGAAYLLRRQIADRFQGSDASAVAVQQMRDGLATLLERGALSPLDAAQVFYENVDLAPPGREGDDLIRSVAEKLVALDLVAQAAELLHHQTFERLRGADRSRVAADLARLYLTDDKPVMALQVLRSTRLARLPAAVNDQRRWLEARALIGTGDQLAALTLLKNDTSTEGAKLSGEVYWSQQQWVLAGDAFRLAAALPTEIDEQLSRDQSVLVLRAASAYGLASARSELRSLGRSVSGKLADTDANHLLEGLAFGGLADDPAEFRAAYRAFFGDPATAS